LAAWLDDRPDRDGPALARQGLATIWPPVRGADGVVPVHGSTARSAPSDEPGELPVGSAANSWRVVQTRVQGFAGYGVPLHASAEPSALAKLADLHSEPSPLNQRGAVSCSRSPVDRTDCWVRDQGCGMAFSCALAAPRYLLRPLRASRSSNHIHRRAVAGGRMRVGPQRSRQRGDRRTMGGQTQSPYRSRASPKRKLRKHTIIGALIQPPHSRRLGYLQ